MSDNLPVQIAKCPSHGLPDYAFDRMDRTSLYFPKWGLIIRENELWWLAQVACFTLKHYKPCTVSHAWLSVTPGKYLRTDQDVYDRGIFSPKWRQVFFFPLKCCRVLKMSSQVVTFVHVLMIGSILCVLFLIPHKGNWKLSYWSSFVGGTFTCKWQQVTHGVCLMCNVNSMLLAEASVYTQNVFFHWVNWNQSLYTWICIVCLWTN